MKRRGLGAGSALAAAALCAAAAAIPALADGPAPAPPSEPLEHGAHRFVFDGERVLYEGPADQRGSVRAALEQAPRMTPQEAYAEAARATLRGLGAPDRQFSSERIVAGADWDGDGVRDVLSVVQTEQGTDVTARDGQDGALIWSWSDKSPDAFAVPAKVGNGEDGVLVVSYTGLGLVVGQVPTMTVSALGRDGTRRWQRRFSGAWAYAGASVVGVGLPLFGQQGQLTPSAATDVVVGRETFVDTMHDGRVRTSFELVDGRQGVTAMLYRGTLEEDELTPVVAPDMTGDGLDDVYLVGARTAALVRGADGTEMWRVDGVRVGRARPVALGDVTGDGVVDVAASTIPAGAPTDLWTTVVEGRYGQPVGFLRGGFPVAAGDVDGDGLVDVATVEVEKRANTTSVVYRAHRASGRPLYRLPYSVHDVATAPSYADVWEAGDVQSDGAADRAHVIRTYQVNGAVRLADEGVVSGRTGLRLWSGRPGTRANGAIKGGGEDLLAALPRALQAQDGATGQPLWSAELTRSKLSWAEAVGDVTGDGHGEVVAYVSQGKPVMRVDAVVLSGLDGRALWGTNLVLSAS